MGSQCSISSLGSLHPMIPLLLTRRTSSCNRQRLHSTPLVQVLRLDQRARTHCRRTREMQLNVASSKRKRIRRDEGRKSLFMVTALPFRVMALETRLLWTKAYLRMDVSSSPQQNGAGFFG